MRVRKRLIFLAAALVFSSCVGIYLIIEVTMLPRNEDLSTQFSNLKGKKNGFGNLSHESSKDVTSPILKYRHGAAFDLSPNFCHRVSITSETDVDMEKIFEENKFDDVDGGAWKQGWNIEYDPNMWDENHKLKVFVVPHSHNDPGWIKTFEDYYSSQTEHILNNMLKKLSNEETTFKFIWAEISYFAMWFESLNQDAKAKVKRIIDKGSLEIVTGGWVMNDEANTHYSNMITQLTVGHKWLQDNLDYIPSNSWSIDPFGLSPSMAYILNRAGLVNLLIQRVHYSIKKVLAQRRQLEFRWRQMWDYDGVYDLFTHVMPFYGYDVPHTCGPDPKVCCQFDFKRLPGYGLFCPWKVAPQVITSKNVAARSKMLLDQYRKKAQLYRTNVIIAPLGDDFRYDHSSEWDNQHQNYQRIFNYLNSQPDLHVEAKFGTLSDFFDALREELPEYKFPSLSGDFFTYADRNDHYWSGYYTSRPFHKRMDRVLMAHLRSAEIAFAMAWGQKKKPQLTEWLLSDEVGLLAKLEEAQRHLSLFQHHDGVTGTAKDHVVEDYGLKMLKALENCRTVMENSIHILLSPNMVLPPPTPFEPSLIMDETRKDQNSLDMRLNVLFNGANEARVVIFNPLNLNRDQNVILRVTSPHVQVSLDKHGKLTIPSQTIPVFIQDENVYDLVFTVHMKELELRTFTLKIRPKNKSNYQSKVRTYNFNEKVQHKIGETFREHSPEAPPFLGMDGKYMHLTFNDRGLLTTIRSAELQEGIPVNIGFSKYGTRPGSEQSGAYLFLPDGPAKINEYAYPKIRIIEGPLLSQLQVEHPGVRHMVTMHHTQGIDSLSVEIVNEVDISDFNNFELAMIVNASIKNGDEFHTDLNGLSMIKRKRYNKIPLQGNFYPMPTAAFIEDESTRMTIFTAQPVGVGMLTEGQLQVMLDRRLMQDDQRGLEQGVQDTRPIRSVFRIFLERKKPNCLATTLPNHSIIGHKVLNAMLHPFHHFLVKPSAPPLQSNYLEPVQEVHGATQDIHLVSMKTIVSPKYPSPRAGVVMHRWLTDTCLASFVESRYPMLRDSLDFRFFLPGFFGSEYRPATLTFVKIGNASKRAEELNICPMELRAVVLELEGRN